MRANQAGKVKELFLPKYNHLMNAPVERRADPGGTEKNNIQMHGGGYRYWYESEYLEHIFEPLSRLLRKYLIKIIKKKVSC